MGIDGFAVGLYQCSDTLDNDLDGDFDYPDDADCLSYADNSEASTPTSSLLINVSEENTCVSAREPGTGTLIGSTVCQSVGFTDPTLTVPVGAVDEIDLQVVRPSGQDCTFRSFRALSTEVFWDTNCTLSDGTDFIAMSALQPFYDMPPLKEAFVTTQLAWYDIVSTTDKAENDDLNWFMYNRTKAIAGRAYQLGNQSYITEAIETAQWYMPFFNWNEPNYPGGWENLNLVGSQVRAGDAKFTHVFPIRFLYESGIRSANQLVADAGYTGTFVQMLEALRVYSMQCGWSAQEDQEFTDYAWNGRFAGFCTENLVQLCEMGHAASCTSFDVVISNLYDHHQTISVPSDPYTGAWLHSWAANEGNVDEINVGDDCRGFSPWMEGGILIPALVEAWHLTRDSRIETMVAEFGWALDQYAFVDDPNSPELSSDNNSNVITWYFACPFDLTRQQSIMTNDGFGSDQHLPEIEYALSAALFFERRKVLPIQERVDAFQARLASIEGTYEGNSLYTPAFAARENPKRIFGWQNHGTGSMSWLRTEGNYVRPSGGSQLAFVPVTVNAGAPSTPANGIHSIWIVDGNVAMSDHAANGVDPIYDWNGSALTYVGELPKPNGLEESETITIRVDGVVTEVMAVHGQNRGSGEEATIFYNGQTYQGFCFGDAAGKVQQWIDADEDGAYEALCQAGGAVREIDINSGVMSFTDIGNNIPMLQGDLYSKAACGFDNKVLTDQGLFELDGTPIATGFPTASLTPAPNDPGDTFVKGGFACGDFNGDGYTDVWFSSGGVDYVAAGKINLIQGGPGASLTPVSTAGSGLPTIGGADRRYTLSHAVDLNDDGCDDLVLSSQGGVWESNCDMTFTERFSWPYTWPVRKPQTAVGDFDGDGKKDICVTPEQGANNSTIPQCFRNTTGQ